MCITRVPLYERSCLRQSFLEDAKRPDDLQIASNKVTPMQAGGAFMLGGEQDCYGGCTDASQAFYGLMDEVRLSLSILD